MEEGEKWGKWKIGRVWCCFWPIVLWGEEEGGTGKKCPFFHISLPGQTNLPRYLRSTTLGWAAIGGNTDAMRAANVQSNELARAITSSKKHRDVTIEEITHSSSTPRPFEIFLFWKAYKDLIGPPRCVVIQPLPIVVKTHSWLVSFFTDGYFFELPPRASPHFKCA